MNNLKYWVAFSSINCIGSVFIRKLWEHFGSIKEAWLATNADLLEIQGIKTQTVENFVAAKKNVNPEEVLENVLAKGIKVLTLEDSNYPYLLKQIYDMPAVLYIKGDIDSCNLDKTLAIVGSRRASFSIREILDRLISDFYGTDITIVSGGAAGVDTYAHKAALKNNLKTIAVLGNGFDYIFPSSNKQLFKDIEINGAVITEYYPAQNPDKWTFPARNRIVSGLSKGTLIAEAGLKSGALITARLCLEQNRELMCIPGQITNPNTEGVHKLLKEGAGIVTCAEDVLNLLNWRQERNTGNLKNDFKIELLDNERQIYEILNLEAKQFDEILNESKINVNELMVLLTTMELKGIIKQLPGQKFIKVI